LLDPYYFSVHGQYPAKSVSLSERLKSWVNFSSDGPGKATTQAIVSNCFNYGFIRVPTSYHVTAYLENIETEFGITDIDISCNYSVIKPLAGIAQIIYGSFELYQARGDQISRFGYAAYSLTIMPYILMSFLNLAAALCQPEYPYLYMVNHRVSQDLTTDSSGLGESQMQITNPNTLGETEGQLNQAAHSTTPGRPHYRDIATGMTFSSSFTSCAVGEASATLEEYPTLPSKWEVSSYSR
jgi:hypothetical protein